MCQTVFPSESEQQRCGVERPHLGLFGLWPWKPFVKVTHRRAELWRNDLSLMPLAHGLWSPDKLVEWYEEWTHALNAAKLVSELPA